MAGQGGKAGRPGHGNDDAFDFSPAGQFHLLLPSEAFQNRLGFVPKINHGGLHGSNDYFQRGSLSKGFCKLKTRRGGVSERVALQRDSGADEAVNGFDLVEFKTPAHHHGQLAEKSSEDLRGVVERTKNGDHDIFFHG